MKRTIFLTLIIIMAAVSLTAAPSVNDNGTFNLQLGTGFSPYYATTGNGYVGRDNFLYIVPIMISANWGVHEVFSAGFTMATETLHYTDYGVTFLKIGGRGDFHLNKWIKVDNLDVYLGVMLGIDLWFLRIEDREGITPGLFWNVQAGVKYYLNDVFGFWAEAGYGYSIFSVGIVFRFQ